MPAGCIQLAPLSVLCRIRLFDSPTHTSEVSVGSIASAVTEWLANDGSLSTLVHVAPPSVVLTRTGPEELEGARPTNTVDAFAGLTARASAIGDGGSGLVIAHVLPPSVRLKTAGLPVEGLFAVTYAVEGNDADQAMWLAKVR